MSKAVKDNPPFTVLMALSLAQRMDRRINATNGQDVGNATFWTNVRLLMCVSFLDLQQSGSGDILTEGFTGIRYGEVWFGGDW